MELLKNVLCLFDIRGEIQSCQRYGKGHINDTYLLVTSSGKYILQRINKNVFRDVPALMRNIVGTTSYIIAKLEAQGAPVDRALRVILTKNGDSFAYADGEYYRMYNFIGDSESIDIPSEPHLMYLSGKGYGNFQKLLDGYPAEQLSESIPHFHDTEDRLNKFCEAISEDVRGRAKEVEKEIDFYLSRGAYASRITSLIASGDIPLRVTHNDTKLNNVLIDLDNDIAAAVIDLDTVMPGSIVYDFGDGIRSGANTGAEDERELAKVGFSVAMYEAFAQGFLEEVANVLTESEIDNLAFGAQLMTYECGMRFLTDYLAGDVYFKISRKEHNLDRARTQIKMVEEMEQNINEMNRIVRKYAAKNKNSR